MKRDFNAWLASLGAGRAGEDAGRSARVQPRARRIATPSSTARRSSTSRTKWISSAIARSGKPIARRTSTSAARTASRKRSRRTSSTRCSSPARAARASRPSPGYPTVIVPFAMVPERADQRAVPGRVQREAGALRRQLHRRGVQRAAADRAGVRVRAGDEEARAAGLGAVIHREQGDRGARFTGRSRGDSGERRQIHREIKEIGETDSQGTGIGETDSQGDPGDGETDSQGDPGDRGDRFTGRSGRSMSQIHREIWERCFYLPGDSLRSGGDIDST